MENKKLLINTDKKYIFNDELLETFKIHFYATMRFSKSVSFLSKEVIYKTNYRKYSL